MTNNYLLPVLILVTPSLVLANNLQDDWEDKDEKNPWSGYISVDYSRNGYRDSASLADRSTSATGVLRYSLSDQSRMQLVISGYDDRDSGEYGRQGQFWNDTSISYSRNNMLKPTGNSSISGEARLILPTSKFSRRDDLNFGTRLKARWAFSMDDYLDGLTLSNTLYIQKNFHEYKTSGDNQLIEYRVSNQFTLDYSFKEDFYFNMFVMPRQAWNYHGRRLNPDILHGEEFGYQITKKIGLAIGMTNAVSYYDPEQGSNPINDLVDLQKGTYYISANYQF